MCAVILGQTRSGVVVKYNNNAQWHPARFCICAYYTSSDVHVEVRGEGARRYLNSAHIKTQPGVVASSKLVPFEIQQTSRHRDVLVCVIRQPVRPGRFYTDS